MMSYDIETKCLHIESKEASCDRSGAISFPIYQTATFAHLVKTMFVTEAGTIMVSTFLMRILRGENDFLQSN